MPSTAQKLTTLQWAIIATLRIEPRYRFVSNEKRAAERMNRDGLLIRKGEHNYRVSIRGAKAYEADPSTILFRTRV